MIDSVVPVLFATVSESPGAGAVRNNVPVIVSPDLLTFVFAFPYDEFACAYDALAVA